MFLRGLIGKRKMQQFMFFWPCPFPRLPLVEALLP